MVVMTTTPDTPLIDLDELEALAKAATPGPWRAHHCISKSTISAPALAVDFITISNDGGDADAAEGDAGLIVAMRNSIDALITEVRALRTKAQTREWIAVVERMPERMQDVYFVLGGKVRAGHYDGYWNEKDGYWEPQQVTHWMPRFVPPMPAPPEAM